MLRSLAIGAILVYSLFVGRPVPAYAGTNLVWSDEFDGTNIDLTKWAFDIGNGGSNAGWGNNELEYYTSRTNNVSVTNGALHIRAQRETTNGFFYTSARLKTQGLFSKTYGRIEFRAKLPAGTGMWPALWMLGTNFSSIGWPGCGEIDVAECFGNSGAWVQGSIHSGSYATQSYRFSGGDSVTNFHVYGLDWTTNSISWLVDGVTYGTQTNWASSAGKPFPFPFNQPFYLLMNLAVGGTYVGNPSTNSINPSLPAEMLVDYIRVYDDATGP